LAREAWTVLAASTDRAAIERFIAAHPGTATAATARTRLDDLTRAEERRAALDGQLAACRAAPATDKATACRPVIESDDTPARRLEALTLRGTAHRAAANYDAAIADFTAALALQPGSADLLNHRGIARFLKGGDADRQAALADYTAAVAADARHAEAYNNRAWVLLQLGRAADALPDANRSIELVPTNGYAYDTRGHINEALGRRDAAIRDYERAVAIDATQADSQAALARLRASR
jgi:tetratricopeptide (TPR) repeat protein